MIDWLFKYALKGMSYAYIPDEGVGSELETVPSPGVLPLLFINIVAVFIIFFPLKKLKR